MSRSAGCKIFSSEISAIGERSMRKTSPAGASAACLIFSIFDRNNMHLSVERSVENINAFVEFFIDFLGEYPAMTFNRFSFRILASMLAFCSAFLSLSKTAAAATETSVVISQVYGGGGDSGGAYKYDFV